MNVAQPKAPNNNAPVSGVELKGRRESGFVKHGVENAASDMVNERSSLNTPNLSRQDKEYNGAKSGL